MLEEYNITQTTLKIIGLYANNYHKSIHLREIARETDVDVKSIQLQLKKLERINILSSAVKGRNKEYTLNLGNIITKNYLIMAESFTTILYLKKHFLVKKILDEISDKTDGPLIVFGSFVKGGHTKESDIDLFVITEKKIDKNAILKASDLVNRDINVKASNRAQFLAGLQDKDPLVNEVVANHIILRGIDEFCDIMWRYHAG
ncbi:MAG: nucleotidyltransferase domain-containing protein [Nitrosotalea sp.]